MGRFNNSNLSQDERKPSDRSLTRPGAFSIVLFNPRIPQNTGAIARLCAATGSRLDIVNPLFTIDDKKLLRAGLDYWHLLDVCFFEDENEWLQKREASSLNSWFVETKSQQLYTDVQYSPSDYICFGDEQAGITESILQKFPNRYVSIPQQGVRSINLAICAGVVLYEAIRQVSWRGE